jgi:hypothetical protein
MLEDPTLNKLQGNGCRFGRQGSSAVPSLRSDVQRSPRFGCKEGRAEAKAVNPGPHRIWSLGTECAGKKCTNRTIDFLGMALKQPMSSVEPHQLCAWQVTLVRMSSLYREVLIPFAPY